MPTSQSRQLSAEGDKPQIGLLANGSSGGWNVDVDETTSGPDGWFLQIEGPSVYFYFQLHSLQTLVQLLQFLGISKPADRIQNGVGAQSTERLILGVAHDAPVELRRDDEYDDRFFLVIGPIGAMRVQYSFAGDDLKHIIAALEQVREDLEAE
jgi:hypothetical protein